MKWMGCLNHDLPYSIDNPSEKPRERRATQNWRMRARRRPDRVLEYRSEKNLARKGTKKSLKKKKRASEKGILNGNYALCIMVHNSA
jgi:hypothetical protein